MIIEVDRDDLHRTRQVETASAPLAHGDARLGISGFALTANNVTYGAFGDAMQYWNFFPAAAGWGRVPVWGFADVTESRSDEIEVGRRVYGYFPMADELVVTPGRAHAHGFTDLAVHRQPMASAYNRYLFTDTDSLYAAGREGQQMVLVPLFFTSFVLDDYIGDNHSFGASAAIISSASSKTSIGTAFMLNQRPELRVVGLTSSRNREFVAKLGCYHDVLTYDEVADLPETEAIYVDVAGDLDLRAGRAPAAGEPARAQPRRRRDALGPRSCGRLRVGRSRAGVLLRAEPDQQARHRLGPGRGGPARQRGVACVQRVDGRLARARTLVGTRRRGSDLPRGRERPIRAPRRSRVRAVDDRGRQPNPSASAHVSLAMSQ